MGKHIGKRVEGDLQGGCYVADMRARLANTGVGICGGESVADQFFSFTLGAKWVRMSKHIIVKYRSIDVVDTQSHALLDNCPRCVSWAS